MTCPGLESLGAVSRTASSALLCSFLSTLIDRLLAPESSPIRARSRGPPVDIRARDPAALRDARTFLVLMFRKNKNNGLIKINEASKISPEFNERVQSVK